MKHQVECDLRDTRTSSRYGDGTTKKAGPSEGLWTPTAAPVGAKPSVLPATESDSGREEVRRYVEAMCEQFADDGASGPIAGDLFQLLMVENGYEGSIQARNHTAEANDDSLIRSFVRIRLGLKRAGPFDHFTNQAFDGCAERIRQYSSGCFRYWPRSC